MTQDWKASSFTSVTSSASVLLKVKIHPEDVPNSWPNKPSFLEALAEDLARFTPPALRPCVVKAPTIFLVTVDAFKDRLWHFPGAIRAFPRATRLHNSFHRRRFGNNQDTIKIWHGQWNLHQPRCIGTGNPSFCSRDVDVLNFHRLCPDTLQNRAGRILTHAICAEHG